MAAPKVLGRLSLSAATSANLVVGGTTGESFTVRINNSSTGPAKIKLSISDASATQEVEGNLLPTDTLVPASDFIELTGLTIEDTFFCKAI